MDIPEITPNFEGPGMSAFLQIVSQVSGYTLVACILGMIVAGVFFGIGFISRRSEMGSMAGKVFMGALLGAVVIGGAKGLISWGLGLPFF